MDEPYKWMFACLEACGDIEAAFKYHDEQGAYYHINVFFPDKEDTRRALALACHYGRETAPMIVTQYRARYDRGWLLEKLVDFEAMRRWYQKNGPGLQLADEWRRSSTEPRPSKPTAMAEFEPLADTLAFSKLPKHFRPCLRGGAPTPRPPPPSDLAARRLQTASLLPELPFQQVSDRNWVGHMPMAFRNLAKEKDKPLDAPQVTNPIPSQGMSKPPEDKRNLMVTKFSSAKLPALSHTLPRAAYISAAAWDRLGISASVNAHTWFPKKTDTEKAAQTRSVEKDHYRQNHGSEGIEPLWGSGFDMERRRKQLESMSPIDRINNTMASGQYGVDYSILPALSQPPPKLEYTLSAPPPDIEVLASGDEDNDVIVERPVDLDEEFGEWKDFW